MLAIPNTPPNLLFTVVALIAFVCATMTVCAGPPETKPGHVNAVQAQFRGCESAGWCRFRIESLDPPAQSLYRVYPDGMARAFDDTGVAVAVRDRLNALLASMIHQNKRIMLDDLREVDDGVFAARVTVNEENVAQDPVLLQLLRKSPDVP